MLTSFGRFNLIFNKMALIQKTRINILSYGIKIWTDLSSILSGITRVTDRQTDRRTDRILLAIPRLHYMQRGKNDTSHTNIQKMDQNWSKHRNMFEQ